MYYISKALEVLPWQPVAAVSVLYFPTVIFYRLFFHPLAQFPGPKLAAATRWYEAYFDIVCRGQYQFEIVKMHNKYGPIVRISPYELHIIDPQFHEKLYRQDGRWDKHAWTYDGFSSRGATICTASHDLHKARRMPIGHFFSKARVAARQSIIQTNVTKLCQRLSEFAGTTVNLGAALSAISRDVACQYILNKTYASLEKDDFNVSVTEMFQEGNYIWRITKHFPWFGPAMQLVPSSLISRFANDGTKAFFQFLKETEVDTKALIRDATAPPLHSDSPRTIVHEIVQSGLPPSEKKFARVFDDVATVTGAGFETAASTLRLIMYHVFSNGEILQKLRTELSGVSTDPDTKILEQLPYLTSVIMEGLRLSPGIGTRMARIANDRDLHYGKWRIPAGTPVGMTTILMHTNGELYPEPLSFIPDRWMDPEARRKQEKTYAPFSRGTRVCLGMHLAWAQMYLIIFHVVTKFDFHFVNVEPADFLMDSDQFIIGTRGKSVLNGLVSVRGA